MFGVFFFIFASQTSSRQLFFWGLTTKLGLALLSRSAGAALVFPHKAPNWECQMGSNASEKQPAGWPNKWISKKLNRLCEATIQVDATNNACTSRTRRINQDDAVCSNITGVVFSHALKWSSLEQFLQWMSHCLSWMVYSELFLFSKNGGEILFSTVCEPSYLPVPCWHNTAFHSTVALKL